MSPQTQYNLVHKDCSIFVIVFWYSTLEILENSVIAVEWLTTLKGLPQLTG